MLSVIGFGGIVVMNSTPEMASASVKQAIMAGVNYFDVAPTYGDAEVKLGWYEPLTKNDEMLLGLRFTLSHPVNTAIPPGEADLFEQALIMSDNIKPLTGNKAETVKTKALNWNPLFTYTG